ncbi:hypothetical protein DFH09DRAFT_1154704 [Mycena vulgaris]|nr:hypothetical protein DFH09DRAFT_1154704 [Mycena vulgaris]
MVGGVPSDSPRTRRMRMVRGRKGGSADGEMDDGEAGTGAAMAGRGSHGLSQCHSGAAERPGGQGDARTDYKPARWCAGGHPSSNQYPRLARTPLDAPHRLGYSQCPPRSGMVLSLGCYQRAGGQGEQGRKRACAMASQAAIYFSGLPWGW